MIYEENKSKYIAVALIVLAVFVVAAFIYQQKTIMDLKKQVMGNDAESMSARKEATKNNPSTVKGVQKSIVESTKELKGVIVSKNGNILGIEADVVDFSKLSGLTEEELQQSISTFPKTKKKFEVSVSDKTQLAPTKLENLSEGTMIIVESSDPVYKNDRFTASKISLAGDDPALAGASIESQIKQSKYIVGGIKEIGKNYLIISSAIVDLAKITDFNSFDARTAPTIAKDYKVFFDQKTKFPGKKLSDIKVGEGPIRADSSVPVYSISDFTATKIDNAL